MKRGTIAALLMLYLALPAAAHHSFAAEYDGNKPVTVKGTLKKVDWQNPHIYYFVEAMENGKPVLWTLEGYPPSMLVRRPEGWTRDKVLARLGDQVTVTGWASRLSEHAAHSRNFTFSDGSVMEAGPGAGNGGPPQ